MHACPDFAAAGRLERFPQAVHRDAGVARILGHLLRRRTCDEIDRKACESDDVFAE